MIFRLTIKLFGF